MSARSELVQIYTDTLNEGHGIVSRTVQGNRAAGAILAAGYRKPRTITTAEELDALPAKSVILDRSGTPWVSDGDPTQPWASVCEDPYGGPIWEDSARIALPATVLHEGEKP